ncbi:hypothetical protein LCGC14_1797180 [marine sediment metagenome]|uniref:Type II toxin-antitoxin system PemK/MazF family toxin n=1 Tax=marine sediment metagenome TaxID=412755 RepID=A0A0F9GQT5_9ZZZZ
MAKKQYYYKKGDIVETVLPHKENLKIIEKRTVLIILRTIGNMLNVLRMTTKDKKYHEPYRIILHDEDLLAGKKLKQSPSYILLNEPATIDTKLIKRKYGKVNKDKMNDILKEFRELYK